MRITHGMQSARLLTDLRQAAERVDRSQSEVSSGYKLQRPSDDPLAAREAVLRRGELEAIDNQREGVSAATSWLGASDAALGKVGDLLARAKELAVQGANGTYSQANREQIALEIDQLAQAAKDAMNAQLGGVSIFSGTATTTAPYGTASDAYLGDAGVVARSIGPGVSVQVNVSGAAVLGGGTVAADGLVLDTLRTMATQLRGGTPADLAGLRGQTLQRIEANITNVAGLRAGVGGTQNRVDAASERLDQMSDTATAVLADLEAADLPEVLLRLTDEKAAYEAALKTGASVLQTSLLDFLR